MGAIEPNRRRELTFSEYLHFVCAFIMLSGRDLGRFLFYHADDDDVGYLTREQFVWLMNLLVKGSPFNVKQWEYQYEEFHGTFLELRSQT